MIMIEESYVSFETAKMLKEAGFEANLKTRYVEEEKDEWAFWDSGTKRSDYNYFDDTITCPTQALAARWLREVYGIMIVSFFDDYMEKWYYVIDGVKKQSGIKCVQSASDYDDYETALEAGLQEAIKLINK